MHHRAAGIFGLQTVLQIQRLKNIIGKIYRQMRGVGVKRLTAFFVSALIGANDIRVHFFVFLARR